MSKLKLAPIALALLASAWTPVNAQSVQTAVDAVNKVLNPAAKESSAPINVIRREEAWGDNATSHRDPMPFRGRPEQLADERQIDDRKLEKDQPLRKKPAKVIVESKAGPVYDKNATKPQVGVKAVVAKAPVTTQDEQGVCVNVQRVWDSSAYVAQQGGTDKAYAAYLRLFKTCVSESELAGTAWQASKNLGPDLIEKMVSEEAVQNSKSPEPVYLLKSSLIYSYNKQKQDDKVLALGSQVKQAALDRKDAALLGVIGWAHQRAKQYKEAESLFRASLKADSNVEANREGLVFSLLAQNKVLQAAPEVDKLTGDSLVSARASLFQAQARQAYADKEYTKTLALLKDAQKHGAVEDASTLALKGWALKGAKQPAEAAAIFKELLVAEPTNAEYAAGYTEAVIAVGDLPGIKYLYENPPVGQSDRSKQALAAVLESQGRSEQANALLGKTVESTKTSFSLLGGVRVKSGDAGKDKATITVAPEVAGSVAVGESGKIEVAANRVKIDDGVQAVTGTEARIAYIGSLGSDNRIKLGIGASKVGGDTRLTVDSAYRQYLDNGGHIEGGLSIQPVMDSVRSYAGKSVANGKTLLFSGQAMENKFSLNGVTPMFDEYKLTWSGAAGAVTGKNFESTSFFDTRAALTKDFGLKGFSWAALGPEVRLAQYSVDQNRWGAGFGGFYSPLSEMGAGLRYSLMSQEGGKYLFKSTGFAGMMKKEFFGGATSNGMLIEVDASAAMILSKHIVAKGGLSFKTSSGYNDVAAFAGLEFSFEPRTKLYSFDLPVAPKSLD